MQARSKEGSNAVDLLFRLSSNLSAVFFPLLSLQTLLHDFLTSHLRKSRYLSESFNLGDQSFVALWLHRFKLGFG